MTIETGGMPIWDHPPVNEGEEQARGVAEGVFGGALLGHAVSLPVPDMGGVFICRIPGVTGMSCNKCRSKTVRVSDLC
ncbi:hypothetical protein KIPB_012849 [Kipferlia bialata]|uniref:Uncharacterized protein n=1 Tax=Kipferlia bialata TaxID=797122 RepID=A0A391NRR6_9EUKA|nr:hypothetical protein KIPB_012849 [Kipferlia bialata]|eukprot:g12849.t1